MKSLKILSILAMCFMSGCKNPDAFICTLVIKNTLEKSYAFCVNSQTKEEKSVPITELHKWITTDPSSYEKFRTFYQEQCGRQNVKGIAQDI